MDTVSLYQVMPRGGPGEPFEPVHKPGRWSSGERPAVYASCHAATGLLEFLANLESSLPDVLLCARTTLRADRIETLDALPEGWQRRPYQAHVQQVGDAWLASARSLALRVPSVLVPAAFNVLLNPVHPDFAACRPDFTEAFRLDGRLG